MDRPPAPERLLMSFRPDLPRRLEPRERRVELLGAVAFVAVAVAMLVLLPSARGLELPVAVGLVLFHAVCAHIRVYVGAGCLIPTELALITMLFFLPAGAVPLAVAAGIVLAAAFDVARRTAHPERVATATNDAWHAIGPALVVYAVGEPAPTTDVWILLVPLLAAQFAFDVAATTAREWIGRGIRPQLQVEIMGWVCAFDLLLAPVALLAAVATQQAQAAWLLAAPLAILLGLLAEDRRRRIAEAAAGVQELRRERERLQEVLRRASNALAVNLDREALLAAITETATEALRADIGWAATAEDADPPPATLLADDGSLLDMALVAAVDAARAGGEVATAAVGGWHAVACPLRRRAYDPETIALGRRQPFTREEQDLVAHLAAQTSMSLENAALHDRLREQAMIDELTGLANHRRFHGVLAHSLEEAARSGEPVGLIMLDLDDFKVVNDAYGHEQGDVVLRLAGRAIRDCCRHFDLPARYGGGEIAIVVPGSGIGDTYELAERIRDAIGELRFPVPDGSWHQVTLSAGAACFPEAGGDQQTLLSAAEDALYRAKRAGKNRTAVAREILVAG